MGAKRLKEIKAMLDEHTCESCRACHGVPVKNWETLQKVERACTNPDGCRCVEAYPGDEQT